MMSTVLLWILLYFKILYHCHLNVQNKDFIIIIIRHIFKYVEVTKTKVEQ